MSGYHSIIPFGTGAALVTFKDDNFTIANQKVLGIYHQLNVDPFPGFIESVPAYNSITVIYDLEKITAEEKTAFEKVSEIIEKIITSVTPDSSGGKLHEIHVKYGGDLGPDLIMVAAENNISAEELIRLHTERDYDVYMVGFTGGFPYLGFTHEKLTTGRKEVPDSKVKPGSVALAGNQTGIYPFESPGAWKIIGHTDYKIFDPEANEPAIIKPGDKVRFVTS